MWFAFLFFDIQNNFSLNHFVFADQHNKPSQDNFSGLKEDIMSATIASTAETEADSGNRFLFTLCCMEVKTVDLENILSSVGKNYS